MFVDALELRELGFDGVTPAATFGRPGYHPSPMLQKLYIYGYLNFRPSNRVGGWSR